MNAPQGSPSAGDVAAPAPSLPAPSGRSPGPPPGVHHGPQLRSTRELLKVSPGALGVVYGDIGTSPLYALKECFAGGHGVALRPGNVCGVLSLFFWILTLLVVFKYLSFILRADNDGEGGILSLLPSSRRAAASARTQRGRAPAASWGCSRSCRSGGRRGSGRWRKALFAFLSRNARPATAFFGIPPNRVVEMGAQIEL
jgi:K+ transporter